MITKQISQAGRLGYGERKDLQKREFSMTGWASTELQLADLGDTRRNKRLVRLVEDLAAQQLSQCTASLRRLGSDPGRL